MTTDKAPDFRLAASAADRILVAWAAVEDAEPCGYLVGSVVDGVGCRVDRAWAGINVHPEPRRAFRLDPDEHLEARRRARAEGASIVGLWHGHLAGPPRPSRADREGVGPFAPPYMLIVGREGAGAPVLRAYVRGDGGWREVPVGISDRPPSAAPRSPRP